MVVAFFGFGLFYGRGSHLTMADYWRWFVVHLWVESIFEFFGIAVIALLMVAMGLTLTLGVLNIPMFAHGEYFMIGSLTAYYVFTPINTYMQNHPDSMLAIWGPLVTVLAAMVVLWALRLGVFLVARIRRDGSDGVSEVSYIMLELVEDIHLLQPGASVHISGKTPDKFLHAACKVIRQGHGYPSVFNPDIYIQEMLRSGKSLEDAREGGCSGCIEVGAFGKEAFLLTGYLNVPKVLEVTLNNGIDPVTGKRAGIETGDPRHFESYDELYAAFQRQLNFIVDTKVRVSNYIDRMFAKYAPAPFLSVVIEDCISKGRDYYDGGPRYNTNYIQCTGLGTTTDSLAVLKKHVFEDRTFSMERILDAVAKNFEGEEFLRQTVLNKTPFFGNDDDYADDLALTIYHDLLDAIDGKPNVKGETYHLNMLSTTCHIYFGKVMGATPNGRLAGKSISDGTSPSHGADTHGPSAVIRSLTKLDHTMSGGTLLNQRFLPSLLKRDEDVTRLGQLIRSYFTLGGHHIQFNIVDTATLKAAQESPEDYKDLLVRMAGYSDYFNDMNADLQQEVIERTENESF